MVDFLGKFRLVFFRNACLFQFLPVFVRFLFLAYRISQAVVDGLDFLAQVVVLLFFIHFGADIAVDFRFQPSDLDFLVQHAVNQAKPVHNVRLFQYVLPLFRRQDELGGQEIGGFAGIRNGFQLFHLLIGKALLRVAEPFEEFLQKGSSVGLCPKFIVRGRFFQVVHFRHEASFAVVDAPDFYAGHPFCQYPHQPAGELEHLADFRYGAYGVYVRRLFSVPFQGGYDIAVAPAGKAHRVGRILPAYVKVHRHFRINYNVLQRYQGQGEAIVFSCLFTHI